MYRPEVRTYKGDLDVTKIRLLYSDAYVNENDSVIICNPIASEMNLYLHSASGSRKTYLIKNSGWDILYVYLAPTDTFDLDIGDVWAFTEIFPAESIEITDYAPGSWVMLDFHFFWEFRNFF